MECRARLWVEVCSVSQWRICTSAGDNDSFSAMTMNHTSGSDSLSRNDNRQYADSCADSLNVPIRRNCM